MGAGIAASPHCAERRICRCSIYLGPAPPKRFVTPLLDPGAPAQASLSTVPLPRERSPGFYSTAPPAGSLVFRRPACLSNLGLSTQILEPEFLNRRSCDPKSSNPSPGQSRSMFRGPSWDNLSRVPLRSPKFRRTPGAASHDRKIISSGASSRLARTKPKLHTFLPAEIGSSVPSSPFLPFPAFRRDWDVRPDHLK